MALLEKAARQGHMHAAVALGDFHHARGECAQAVEWFTQCAEAGVPRAMFSLGQALTLVQISAQPQPFLTRNAP